MGCLLCYYTDITRNKGFHLCKFSFHYIFYLHLESDAVFLLAVLDLKCSEGL